MLSAGFLKAALATALLVLTATSCGAANSPIFSVGPLPAAEGTVAIAPAPEPVLTIALAQDVPLQVADAVREHLQSAALGVPWVLGDGVPNAQIVITSQAPSDATKALSVVSRYWVPVAHFTSDVDDIALPDLRRALEGELTDWAQLGGSSHPLRVLLPQEYAQAVATVLEMPMLDTGRIAPATDLARSLSQERGVLSVLPLEQVDFHVHSLAVDGVDIVRGIGRTERYSLVSRLWLRHRTPGPADAIVGGLAARLAAVLPTPVRLLAVGDIVPARCVYQRQRDYGDWRHAWLKTADFLSTADYTIGDLEVSLSDMYLPIGCQPTFSFIAPAASVQGLVHAGIDLVTVANNHILDYGVQAFLDGLATLDKAGIAHVGGGRNLAEARAPAVTDIKGTRFAFLGYDDVAAQYYGATDSGPGTAPLDMATLADDVRAAKALADVVVVMVQWIPEYITVPTQRQQEIARFAVEAGATFVYGDGPHVVQGVQLYDNAFVAYSLGNFIFDQDWSRETGEGVILETVYHSSRLVSVRFFPYLIEDKHQPRFLSQDERKSILERLHNASVKLVGAR